MKLFIKRTVIVYAVAVVAISAGIASSALALSNISPNPDDMLALNGNNQIEGGVSHLLKKEGVAIVTNLRVGVYSPTQTKRTLKITYGIDGKKCYQDVDKNKGSIEVKVGSGASAVTYTVPSKNMCTSRTEGKNNSASNSANNRFFADYDIPADAFTEKKDIDLWFAPVTIKMSGDVPVGKSQGNNVNFRLEIADNKVKIGPLATADSTNFGLRSAYADTDRPARGVMVRASFGAPCSAGDPEGGAYLYDADVNVFGPTYLWATKGGNKLARDDYKNPSFLAWDPDLYWRSTAQEGSESTRNSSFTIKQIEAGKTYKFIIRNPVANGKVSPNANVMSIGIPYDSIYGDVECGYELTPNVNPPADSNDTVTQGSVISPVKGLVKVKGFSKDDHEWRLTARVYNSKPSDRAEAVNEKGACIWKAGDSDCQVLASGSRKFGSDDFDTSKDFNTSGVNAGSWVCFMMSVQKPKDTSASTKWSHSVMKCVGVKADTTRTEVTPRNYSYYPNLNVTSTIKNTGGYPMTDTFKGKGFKRQYPWEIYEVKFTSKPSGTIGTAQGGACANVSSKYGGTFISGSCKKVADGDNLFPNSNAEQKKSVSNLKKDTPDPIGTWTCYTFRYLNNPEPSSGLQGDINNYIGDVNDTNSTSKQPSRWSDGYYRVWVPATYDNKGKVKVPGHYEWIGNPAPSYDSLYGPYRDAAPATNPQSYNYTAFKDTACSVAGIDPKIQVNANDVRVSGKIQTSLRAISAGPYASNFGSWGEYGVLSSGVNKGMASGANLNGGGLLTSTQANWSTLTFANNSSTYGQFNGGMWREFNPSNTTPGGSNVTINDGNKAAYTTGKTIYKVNGTLTINTNLTYGNSYASVGEIPRVILVADNIIIGPNVTQIDPWLITEGALNTCSAIPLGDGFAGAALTADGACKNKLTFNGMVMAGKIYLFRTAGSRDSYSSPDGKKTLSDAAEVFNLRPDAYLSSFSNSTTQNPVAVTDRITELPPRF